MDDGSSSGTRGAPGNAVNVNCIVIMVSTSDGILFSVFAPSLLSPVVASEAVALDDEESSISFCVDMIAYLTSSVLITALC